MIKQAAFSALVTITLLALSQITRAIEPEPDWSARYEAIKAGILQETPAPKVGDRITVTRRIGGPLAGRVYAITENTITIGSTEYRANQLTPESAANVFASQQAATQASLQLASERNAYAARHAEEIRQRQVQEAARQAAIYVPANAQSTAAPRRIVTAPRQAATQSGGNSLADGVTSGLVIIGIIIASVLGFLLYILPAIIAGKRGHHNFSAILALTILLGWSFLGWVAAFVWSMTEIKISKSQH